MWGTVREGRAGGRKGGSSSGPPLPGPGCTLQPLVELKVLPLGPPAGLPGDPHVQQRLQTPGLGPHRWL